MTADLGECWDMAAARRWIASHDRSFVEHPDQFLGRAIMLESPLSDVGGLISGDTLTGLLVRACRRAQVRAIGCRGDEGEHQAIPAHVWNFAGPDGKPKGWTRVLVCAADVIRAFPAPGAEAGSATPSSPAEPPKRKQGAFSVERVREAMQAKIDTGSATVDSLRSAPRKELRKVYHADEKTIRKALGLVTSKQ